MMANNPHNGDYSTGHGTEQRSLLEKYFESSSYWTWYGTKMII